MDERRGVFRAHERGADKDRIDPRRKHPRVIDRTDARLGDEDLVRMDECVQLPHTADIDLGRAPKVPRVHADDLGATRNCATKGCELVGLDERSHSQAFHKRDHLAKRIVLASVPSRPPPPYPALGPAPPAPSRPGLRPRPPDASRVGKTAPPPPAAAS